jgi:type I restriction enzyme, S subunit
MKYGLSQKQIDEINEVFATYDEIEEAILFGSRAINTFKEASDVDIAIKGENITLKTVANLKYELEEETYIPFFFDVVAFNSVQSEELKKHINMKGVSLYQKLMSEWREVKLSDIADVRDGTHDSPKESKEGKFLITSKHIKYGKIDFSKAYLISKNDFEAVNKRSKVDKYDILFSMIGTIGEMVIIDFEPDFAIKNVGLFKTSNKDLSQWIYYYFKSNDAQAEIDASLKGSTQQYITLGDLRNFPIKIPPLEEQKAIAEVLSSLDDKIDLLHRQNKTLESMAETLFRQWFVEEVGEDWEEGTLGDFAENIKQSVKPTESDTIEKYIGLEHIDKRNIALLQSGLSSDVSSNKFRFDENDILFGKLRPYFHKVCFAPFEGISSTDILVIRPRKAEFFCFCLFAFFQDDVVEYANLGSGGTRMPRTDWNFLKKYELKIPGIEKIVKFNEIILPDIHKVKQNLLQIQTLENLRDTLLPKLMSGEVRVKLNG